MQHNKHCVSACKRCFPLGRGSFYALKKRLYKGIKIWLPYGRKLSIPAWIPDWKPKAIHGTYSFEEVCNKDPYVYFEPGKRGVFAWVRGTSMVYGGSGENRGPHLGAFIASRASKKQILQAFLWNKLGFLSQESKDVMEQIRDNEQSASEYPKILPKLKKEASKLRKEASKLRIIMKNIK